MKNLSSKDFKALLEEVKKETISIEYNDWIHTEGTEVVGVFLDEDYQIGNDNYMIEIELDISQNFTTGKGNPDPFAFMAHSLGGFCSVLFEVWYKDIEYKLTSAQQIEISKAVQNIIE